MTYTTEEKVIVEGLRYQSKLDTLKAISDLETVYKDATEDARETYKAGVAGVRAASKETLSKAITDVLSVTRSQGTEIVGDDDE